MKVESLRFSTWKNNVNTNKKEFNRSRIVDKSEGESLVVFFIVSDQIEIENGVQQVCLQSCVRLFAGKIEEEEKVWLNVIGCNE